VKTNLPKLDEKGSIWLHSKVILDIRENQLHKHMIKEVLIQWKYMQLEDATWEPTTIRQQFTLLKP